METETNQPGKEKDPVPNPLFNILNNALQSSAKFGEIKGELETRTCPNCSAARPDGTDLKYCDYCGHQFF